MVKNLPANAGDVGLIPELGKSPGEGNGNPLRYSCLGNSMDRGDLQATVLAGYSRKESDTTVCARARTHTHTHTHTKSGKVNLKSNKQKLLELKV